MQIADAQKEMRRAYVHGGPGVMVSGLVWLVAALVEARAGTASGFAALFVGGCLIFPLSKLIVRFLFGRPDEARESKFGMTALESTIAMLGGFVPAYLAIASAPHLVFPFVAIAVGTHYFAFRTVYGDVTYWVLGGAITAAGALAIFVAQALPVELTFLIAAIELVFGALLLSRGLKAPAG